MGNAATTKKGDSTESGEYLLIPLSDRPCLCFFEGKLRVARVADSLTKVYKRSIRLGCCSRVFDNQPQAKPVVIFHNELTDHSREREAPLR